MRQIIVQEFVSIDGVMQAPGDPSEYEHGGWQRQFVCPEQLDHVTQFDGPGRRSTARPQKGEHVEADSGPATRGCSLFGTDTPAR